MTTEPEPKQEAGIGARVRSATTEDAAAIAAVHVASWRSTYRALLPDEFLARLSADRREAMWREQLEAIQEGRSKSCLLVAQQSPAELIGFASAGPEREQDAGFQGELYAIYLLEEHQGKGLGRRLFRAAARHQRSLGYNSMRVWVLQGNPAHAFYRRLGGKPVAEKTIRIADQDHTETAYGWNDLASLDTDN